MKSWNVDIGSICMWTCTLSGPDCDDSGAAASGAAASGAAASGAAACCCECCRSRVRSACLPRAREWSTLSAVSRSLISDTVRCRKSLSSVIMDDELIDELIDVAISAESLAVGLPAGAGAAAAVPWVMGPSAAWKTCTCPCCPPAFAPRACARLPR